MKELSRPRVLVVSRAAPALGGIPAFAEMICSDAGLAADFDISLLNTTRRAVRRGGEPTLSAVTEAVVDSLRVFRAARRCDVVHIQTALTPSVVTIRTIALIAAARLAKARVLCHVHSADLSSGRAEGWSPGRIQNVLLRGLRIADGVLCVSEPAAAVLRERLPSTRIEVVDNAVDVVNAPKAVHNGGKPKITYVGTLTKRKGLIDLIAALCAIRDHSDPGFAVEIIGGGGEVGETEADELRSVAADAGFGSALVGPLPPEAVLERLARSDVFVSPSHLEGQPIAILEAMAAGLPVVVTDTGANASVVRDGVDGFVVPVGDVDRLGAALTTLVSRADLRRTMGANALKRVSERFDISRLRERLVELYDHSSRSRP